MTCTVTVSNSIHIHVMNLAYMKLIMIRQGTLILIWLNMKHVKVVYYPNYSRRVWRWWILTCTCEDDIVKKETNSEDYILFSKYIDPLHPCIPAPCSPYKWCIYLPSNSMRKKIMIMPLHSMSSNPGEDDMYCTSPKL